MSPTVPCEGGAGFRISRFIGGWRGLSRMGLGVLGVTTGIFESASRTASASSSIVGVDMTEGGRSC